jgi:hypothetical protein
MDNSGRGETATQQPLLVKVEKLTLRFRGKTLGEFKFTPSSTQVAHNGDAA